MSVPVVLPAPVVGDREAQRSAAVAALRSTEPPQDDRFDRITRLARRVFDVPVALVTLVDLDRPWVTAVGGPAGQEVAGAASFDARAVADGRLLVVPDAAVDPRFAHHPAVTGAPHIRFYAGQPVAGPSGSPVGTLCLLDHRPRRLTAWQREALRDMAAWVELEYATPRADQWEQQTERARRDFVSMVGHELRTPLTSIRGSLELIASGRFGSLPPQVRRLVQIAAKNTDRMARLAQDVVDLHQMQRGCLHLRLDRITLPEIVEQAVLAVEDLTDRAGVAVEVSSAEPVEFCGDLDRLVQVLTNLLVNAVHVSPEGEPITVSCGMKGGWAEFAVRDRGPGVPQAQLDGIFEPFVQLTGPNQRATGGAGLGLAVARGIVDAHGGRIHARPAEGGGSVFEVSVPAGGPTVDQPWW